MNFFANANVEVCKALAKGECVRGQWIDEDHLLVTIDGYYAYIFPRKKIYFDAELVKKFDKKLFDVEEICVPETKLKKTNEFYLAGGKMCRKFSNDNGSAFFQQSYLQKLGDDYYEYYQKVSETTKMSDLPMLVVQKVAKGNEDFTFVPVMYIMPMRVFDFVGG